MVVLALETATRAGSLALCVGRECDARAGDASVTHGERLPGEVVAFLAEHGRTLRDVDVFAVVIGPGSFTGLRVGVAAVQGMALVSGRRVIAVPTLDAIAEGWMSRHPVASPTLVVACLDGHRSDVFFAAWQAESGIGNRQSAIANRESGIGHREAEGGSGGRNIDDCFRVLDPQVGRPEDLLRKVSDLADSLPVVLVGETADKHGALFPGAMGVTIAAVEVPLAEVAARIAARHPDRAAAPPALRPIYIRHPDAVLARDRMRFHEPIEPAFASGFGAASPVEPAFASGFGAASPAEPGEPSFVISRLSAQDDLSAVAALQRRAFTSAWGAEAIQWELQNTDVARMYVMRAPGGDVVAYCSCWMIADELHINSLAVDEGWRRRGLARRLLLHVFRDSVAKGATSATLEVRQSNHKGRALYEQLGFSVEGVRRDYYREPREDALVLWNRRLGI